MKITDLPEYVDNFRRRVMADALQEATAAYWLRRGEQFAKVGTLACDEIAQACRNRAALTLDAADATPDRIVCIACGTCTSPMTCSCGQTRIEVAA